MHTELADVAARLGLRASVGGVFCHQTPRVKSPLWRRGCELGDLLVVVQFMPHASGTPRSNALLLQFKIGDLRMNATDPQTSLYLSWPTFRITRGYANGERSRDWSVSAPAPHVGAQYSVIDAANNAVSAVPVCECLDPQCTSRPLAWELTDTMSFGSGREFHGAGPSSHASDWNELVWHLLKQTVRQRLTLKSSGVAPRGYPRGTGSSLCLLRSFDGVPPVLLAAAPELKDVWDDLQQEDNEFWGSFEDSEPPANDDLRLPGGDGGDGGVSVLVVTLSIADAERPE